MPILKEAADPFDVMDAGIPADIQKITGEPEGQQLKNVASALGINASEIDEDENEEGDDEEETPSQQAKGTGAKAAKASTKSDALENYSKEVQEKSEELYAYHLEMAKNKKGHLDGLIQSTKPLDQRMARKLLERNDFGAKTIEGYRKMQAKAAAGDDPVKQELAEIKSSLQELRSERKNQAWSDWKKENSVRGDASKLADEIVAQYPDMEKSDVLALVRGKLGISNAPSMKGSSFGGSRGDMPESSDEEIDLHSPHARGLLKNVDLKKLRKFTKQQIARGR